MDGTIGRRQAIKLFGGLAMAGSLAGCTSEESSDPTSTSSPGGSPTGTSQPATEPSPTVTTSTETPTTTPTATETETTTTTPTATQTATETKSSGEGQTVSFTSSDGRTVKGTLYGSGTCAVIFAHGTSYDRTGWEPQALEVANGGHTALSVSLNHDNRAGVAKTLVGAVSYLREKQSAETVVLAGSSAGASAVVQANTVAGANIDGSVLIAPGRGVEYAPELSGRLLFVVGSGDETRYVGTTKEMHKRASKPKRLVELSTDKHGLEIYDTNQGSKLTNLIVEFANTVCSG